MLCQMYLWELVKQNALILQLLWKHSPLPFSMSCDAITNPNPSPGFLFSSTSNPRGKGDLPFRSVFNLGLRVVPPSSVLIQSRGSSVRVTGTESKKLVLWTKEERTSDWGGGVRDFRSTGGVSVRGIWEAEAGRGRAVLCWRLDFGEMEEYMEPLGRRKKYIKYNASKSLQCEQIVVLVKNSWQYNKEWCFLYI